MARKKITNGWNEYEKLVMDKLSNHDRMLNVAVKSIQVVTEKFSDFLFSSSVMRSFPHPLGKHR